MNYGRWHANKVIIQKFNAKILSMEYDKWPKGYGPMDFILA